MQKEFYITFSIGNVVRIFLTKGSKLVENTEEQFLTEKEIQTLTEQNLHEIFKLEFVTSELQLPGFRIDTLAFNKESPAFYIIEYKKDRNFSRKYCSLLSPFY
jgi:hypothetical protein